MTAGQYDMNIPSDITKYLLSDYKKQKKFKTFNVITSVLCHKPEEMLKILP